MVLTGCLRKLLKIGDLVLEGRQRYLVLHEDVRRGLMDSLAAEGDEHG